MASWVKWSDEEDAILEAVYPHHGTKGALKVLPGRKHSAISMRASGFGYRVLPKEQRSSKSPAEIASDARKKLQKPPSTPLRKAESRRPQINPTSSLGSVAGSEGVVRAIHREGSEAVPDRAIGLPWLSFPKTVDDCRGVIARCSYVLDEFGVNMSEGERAYFESSRKYAQAVLDRLEATENRVN